MPINPVFPTMGQDPWGTTLNTALGVIRDGVNAVEGLDLVAQVSSDVRLNYNQNPSFGVDSTGWSAYGTGASIARSTDQAFDGTHSLKITASGAERQGTYYTSSSVMTAADPGDLIVVSARVMLTAGETFHVSVRSSLDLGAGHEPRTYTASGGWDIVHTVYLVPVTKPTFAGLLVTRPTEAASWVAYVDSGTIELIRQGTPQHDWYLASTEFVEPPFSGDSTRSKWLGTVGASQSQTRRIVDAHAHTSTDIVRLRESAQPATFGLPLFAPGGGQGATLAEAPSFMVKGINLGLTSATGFYDSWTADFDLDQFYLGIEQSAAVGANVVRLIGHFRAYMNNPAQYKERLHAILERCRLHGLKVIYAWMSHATEPADWLDWSTYGSDYEAMIDDLAGAYFGDPLIFAWDIGNELFGTVYTGANPIIENVSAYLKAVDPDHPVTSSQSNGLGAAIRADVAAVEAYVDFQQIHIYEHPSRAATDVGLLDDLLTVTAKPVLIGEFGSNSYFLEGAGTRIGGQESQAAWLRSNRRHFAGGNVLGIVVWKAFDAPGTLIKMGLWDDAGNPTMQVPEFMGYPSVRLDAAKDYTDFRPHPTVLDVPGDRAVGSGLAPLLGATPTAVHGVWGVAAHPWGGGKGIYPTTKDGIAPDKLVYDCRVVDTPRFGAEWYYYSSSATDLGLLIHYVDPTNHMRVRFRSTAAWAFVVVVEKVVAGVVTELGSYIPSLGHSDIPLTLRLDARIVGDRLSIMLWGRVIINLDLSAESGVTATATRGLWRGTGDNDSLVTSVYNYARGFMM